MAATDAKPMSGSRGVGFGRWVSAGSASAKATQPNAPAPSFATFCQRILNRAIASTNPRSAPRAPQDTIAIVVRRP